jgi:glycosyltransferase involved in cell wall biosynthesis
MTEVSVVIPCLNEVKTLPLVIDMAKKGLAQASVQGEIIIADNGSHDGSQGVAESLGARVVPVKEKGYGSALTTGILAAQGEKVIFADADGSYDFSQLPVFINALESGEDLVIGNRFGKKMEKGAMPMLHRYLGTPVLTTLINFFFKTKISDCNCGMRGIKKEAFEKMQILSQGMEFASEMVIKAGVLGMKVTEVPIYFMKDKRDRRPHLRTWRDGWRHLRLILIYAPDYLFTYPGGILFILGSSLLFMQAFGPVIIGPIYMDLHFMILGLMLSILGLSIFLMGATIKQFSYQHDYYLHDFSVTFFERSSFEKKLIIGTVFFVIGVGLALGIFIHWISGYFANPNMLRGALFSLYFMSTGLLISLFSFLELVMRTHKNGIRN